jgi:hypothetical protein
MRLSEQNLREDMRQTRQELREDMDRNHREVLALLQYHSHEDDGSTVFHQLPDATGE